MVQMDWSILSEPVPQLILATAGLLILAVVGIYILQKLRDGVPGATTPAHRLAERSSGICVIRGSLPPGVRSHPSELDDNTFGGQG